MKLIISIFLVYFSCSAFALKLSKSELVWQGLHVIDVLQTANGIGKNSDCFEEYDRLTRLIVGQRPSTDRVYKWGIASAVVHYILFSRIDRSSDDFTRGFIRALDLANKASVVVRNHNKGIRVNGITYEARQRCNTARFGPSLNFELKF